MVYALLHRQQVFEPFRMHARFADILDNIQVSILGFAMWQLPVPTAGAYRLCILHTASE